MFKPKLFITASLTIVTLCLFVASSAVAKSVYAITDHHASKLQAYKIQDSNLVYQADVNVIDYATGAVDVAIDSQLELLFITYEGSARIVWAGAKTKNAQKNSKIKGTDSRLCASYYWTKLKTLE